MRTSTRWITGGVPGTIAATVTGIVPVEPELTRPVESTVPSNLAVGARRKLIRTPDTSRPAESNACAERRTVSPATTIGDAGLTTRRAIGDGERAGAGC